MARKRSRVWHAVVLREEAHGQPLTELERAIRKVAPDLMVWFPAVLDDGTHDETSPFASYIFIQPPVPREVARLYCVDRVLAEDIPERDLLAAMARKATIRPGMEVRGVGPHYGTRGTAHRVTPEAIFVRIDLESGSRVARIERRFVESAE